MKEIFPDEDIAPKEIIDTFFKKSAQDHPQKPPPKKRKKVLLLIAFALLLTLAFSIIIIILYRQRGISYNQQVSLSKFHYSEYIIKDGQINRFDIEEVYFEGDAREKSSFLQDSVKLVNFGDYGRAALTMRFKEFLNLGGKNILILARAESGRKLLDLILKDAQNRFYEFPEISFSPNWNMKHIYLDEKKHFDLKKIKEIKLEFGSHTAGNEENSTIYIKNITVRRPL